MKPKLLIILSFSLLIGCQSGTNIKWERTSLENITQLCQDPKSVGCAHYNTDQKVCTIYTPLETELVKVDRIKATNEVKQWVILGHEAQHCFEGKFHKE